jgi:hypothetical protein
MATFAQQQEAISVYTQAVLSCLDPTTGIFGYGKLLILITKLVAFTKLLVTLQDRARQASTDFQSPSRPLFSPFNIAPEPSQ